MKILYIITQGELGGAQRYVLDLANEFSDNNEVVVANGTQGEQWLKTRCEMSNITTHQFKHLIRKINIAEDVKAYKEIKKYIHDINTKPDIIHVNSTKAGVLVALAKGKVPDIYTVHGWVFNEPMNWLKKIFYILIEWLAGKFHNKIIVLGENDLRVASRLRIGSNKKITVIPHGERHINSIVTKDDLGLDRQNINIVTIANFYKTKGLEYLIRAVDQLKNTRLTIFGDGPERPILESLIQDKNKIVLRGRDSNARLELPPYDIFILPSLKEGFPYAILEAMNAGTPIVATTVGEIPNILENEKTALLVEPANSTALTNAIQKLIDSPELRMTLATNAKKRLVNFSFETMVEKHRQLYTDLVKTAKQG